MGSSSSKDNSAQSDGRNASPVGNENPPSSSPPPPPPPEKFVSPQIQRFVILGAQVFGVQENLNRSHSLIMKWIYCTSLLLAFFGLSHPSESLINGLRSLFNKASQKLTGSSMGTFLEYSVEFIITIAEQYGLNYFLDWAVSSAICLESGDCDENPYLGIIQDMKEEQCGKSPYDAYGTTEENYSACHLLFNCFPFYMIFIAVAVVYCFVCAVNPTDEGGDSGGGDLEVVSAPPGEPPSQIIKQECPNCKGKREVQVPNPQPVVCQGCKDEKNKGGGDGAGGDHGGPVDGGSSGGRGGDGGAPGKDGESGTSGSGGSSGNGKSGESGGGGSGGASGKDGENGGGSGGGRGGKGGGQSGGGGGKGGGTSGESSEEDGEDGEKGSKGKGGDGGGRGGGKGGDGGGRGGDGGKGGADGNSGGGGGVGGGKGGGGGGGGGRSGKSGGSGNRKSTDSSSQDGNCPQCLTEDELVFFKNQVEAQVQLLLQQIHSKICSNCQDQLASCGLVDVPCSVCGYRHNDGPCS